MLRHLICKCIQYWILQNTFVKTFVSECQKKKKKKKKKIEKIALSTIDVY